MTINYDQIEPFTGERYPPVKKPLSGQRTKSITLTINGEIEKGLKLDVLTFCFVDNCLV